MTYQTATWKKTKLWLLKRRTAQRMDVRHALRSARMDLRLLCDLFVLRTTQRRHEELKSANDGARYQAYSYIVLALTEVCDAELPGRVRMLFRW